MEHFYVLIFATLVLITLGAKLEVVEGQGRGKRSDDSSPLESVVSSLTQKVDQLTAQNAALQSRLEQLNTEIRASETPTAFTARFSNFDQTHLGHGQILKFDLVISNQGQGYNPTTGTFTAPSAGTYAFYMNVAQHSGEDASCVQVSLVKNGAPVVLADACNHYLNTGSNMAVLPLLAGDTVNVQVFSGDRLHGDLTSFSGWRI